MKNKSIILQLFISSICFTTFGCNDNRPIENNAIPTLVVNSAFSNSLTAIKTPQKQAKPIFYIRPDYYYSVSKKEIKNLKTLGDFIPDYPSSWIKNYVYVEISFKNLTHREPQGSGEEIIVKSKNDTLSEEQIKAFESAKLGTVIHVKAYYKTENSATNVLEDRVLDREVTVIPSQQAKVIGGKKNLEKSFNKKAEGLLPNFEIDKTMIVAKVGFTINKNGKPENIVLVRTSGDTKTDKLMIKFVTEMKTWKPAKTHEGNNTFQNYELVFGLGC